MNNPKKALLLIGSPKVSESTSESFGRYLLDKMRERGVVTEAARISSALKSDDGCKSLISATDDADIIILAFPLYVDSLPYPVVRALEYVARHRKEIEPKNLRLLAIVNSGFPEARQNNTALAICRKFTEEAEIEWAGGLALGGGEAIAGEPLEKAGGKAKRIRKALQLTAHALSEDMPVPEEAVRLMARPFVPKWLYMWIGGWGWKRKAKKNGVLKKINDKPYGGNTIARKNSPRTEVVNGNH